jgi:hypothetical protein
LWCENLKERNRLENLAVVENNVKIDPKELGYEGVDLINVEHNSNKMEGLVNTEMIFRLSWTQEISGVSKYRLASHEGFCACGALDESQN